MQPWPNWCLMLVFAGATMTQLLVFLSPDCKLVSSMQVKLICLFPCDDIY